MSIRKLFLLAASVLLCAAMCGPARAADDRLTVVQDESSMEKIIESYLTTTHKLTITEKTSPDDKDDLYLDIAFQGDPMPKFRMAIDTQVLNRDKDSNKVIERGVGIILYTDVHVPSDKKGKILDLVNDFNRRKCFSSIYVDTDGEIICYWTLNVLDAGLPTEYVHDAIDRVQNLWKALYPIVAPELGLSK